MKSRTLQGIFIFLGLSYVYFLTLSLIHGSDHVGLDMLCKWDCGWYKAIIRNGYVSTIPPIAQQEDLANVAFFPLYPAIARMVGNLLNIASDFALPLTSILFATGTFIILPFLVRDASDRPDWKRLALIGAYPATFYLWVGYSESAYCFFLVLGLLSFQMKSRYAPIFSLFSGIALGLTRLTGFILAGAVSGVMALEWLVLRPIRRTFPLRPILWVAGSIIGAGSFFLFCYLKFGVWNLYFQTLDIGWHKEASIGGFFNLFFRIHQKSIFSTWSFQDPVKMSWLINVTVILVYVYALFIETRVIWKVRKSLSDVKKIIEARSLKFSLLAGGFTHVMVTALGDSGDWHRWINGMRYTMPAFFMLIIIWDAAWVPRWMESRPGVKRALYYGLIAFWIPYQIYYLYLFSIQRWVS